MSTTTTAQDGHPGVWGEGMELGAWGRKKGAREAYEKKLRRQRKRREKREKAEQGRLVPEQRQSPEARRG
jgi:hypothetical protein